jgi:Ser-tRNA(Ala) deacylase AlaX
MSLKRKTKDDYSDDSLFENENSQKITDKSKKLIKKNKSKNSRLISSDEEENDDDEEITSYKKFKESSKKLNKPAIRIVTETEEVS